jgi:hypothetical protein
MVLISTDSLFEQSWRAIAYLFGTYLMLQKNKMKIMMRRGRIVGNGLLLQVISSFDHFKKMLNNIRKVLLCHSKINNSNVISKTYIDRLKNR